MSLDTISHYHNMVRDHIIQIGKNGSWEGNYTDFKLSFDPNYKTGDYSDEAYAVFLRNVLAFANTPRQKCAFLIYGIDDNQLENKYECVGTEFFPNPKKLKEIITSHTNVPINRIIIDDKYEYNNKLFPFIGIEICEDGPFYLTKKLRSAKSVSTGNIYLRDSKKTVTAEDFQKKMMQDDWENWIVDELYFANTKIIMEMFNDKFEDIELMEDHQSYVKILYNTKITMKEFSHNTKAKCLIHAYPTLDFLQIILKIRNLNQLLVQILLQS